MGQYRSASGEKMRDLKKKTFVDGSGQVRNLKWSGKGRLTNSGPCSTIQFRMMINMTTSFSPSGSDSWCKFKCALSGNEEPPKHTPKLPKDLGPFIKPVFTELSKQELLERLCWILFRIRMSLSITSGPGVLRLDSVLW